MKIEQQLVAATIEAVEALYGQTITPEQVTLQKTKKEFEGHLTLVVFPFLRISRKKPQDTAAELGAWLQENTELIAAFNAVGGFLNLVIAPACWVQLLEEINDDSAYLKDFTFDIVILKVLGDDSGVLAEKLACARTSNQMEKFKALLGGGEAINKLEQVDKCNRRIVKDTEVQRLALNINSVPMVITHDKRFVRGKPSDLRLFLDPEEAERAREREEAQQRQLLKDAAEALMAGPEEAGRVPLKKTEQKRVPLHDNK